MKEITVLSPAKLNLYLDVLGKRQDGYHNIVTFFEKIDLCDEITIKKKFRGIELKCDCEVLPLGKDNLMYKAVERLSGFIGRDLGVNIFFKKNIPISSGLGGGSSNAASIITALLQLYELEIDRESLFGIARNLGADVGFFLTDYIYAIGRGIGDELEGINTGLFLWQVLIRPRVFVSTAEMYERINSNPERKSEGLTDRDSDVKLIKSAILNSDIISVGKGLYNIFEDFLLKEKVLVKEAKELLDASGSIGSCLSGSGPTIFGIFKTREEAMRVKEDLDSQDLTAFAKASADIFVVATYGG